MSQSGRKPGTDAPRVEMVLPAVEKDGRTNSELSNDNNSLLFSEVPKYSIPDRSTLLKVFQLGASDKEEIETRDPIRTKNNRSYESI
jgi:hypothetical protein